LMRNLKLIDTSRTDAEVGSGSINKPLMVDWISHTFVLLRCCEEWESSIGRRSGLGMCQKSRFESLPIDTEQLGDTESMDKSSMMNFFTLNRSCTVYQILTSHWAASTEVLLIKLAAEGFSQRKICSTLSVGDHRVTRLLREFPTEGIIPTPLRRGRPPKVTKAILDFIDIRKLQSAHLSSTKLATQIEDKFHVSLSRSTID
jgi:hypothetical protein